MKESIKRTKWLPFEMIKNFKINKFSHPFFSSTKRVLPGKFEHIQLIYEGLATVNLPRIEKFAPLLTQPMLELCLKIPTYSLYNESFDRYPFRQAVGNYFQTESVWRKDKGSMQGTVRLGLNKNKNYCYDICLNGQLAKNNLIDKKELESHMKALLSGIEENQFSFLQLFAAEIFMNLWQR